MHYKEIIRKLAYEKWQQAGCPIGDSDKFWYKAENEMKLIAEEWNWGIDDDAQTVGFGLSQSEY